LRAPLKAASEKEQSRGKIKEKRRRKNSANEERENKRRAFTYYIMPSVHAQYTIFFI
jgi:hypothetical protein